MSPQITLNSVVLPAPFGPRIARRAHGGQPAEPPADPAQAQDRLGVFGGSHGHR
jgi:hypothetical protein